MMRFFSLCVLLAFCSVANAQNISGTILDADSKPVVGATISLLQAKDSSVVKYTASTAKGSFTLPFSQAGEYLIKSTSVGYSPIYSNVFTFNGENTMLGEFAMQKSSEKLQGVTVSANRPIVEVKADKIVMNVEGTVNAVGNDGLELLRKSPGVLLDQDDNVTLSGKNGVQFYVDGKQTPLSGKDLSNYLKSLQSSSIESLEIITNPSAKYDAAGNAGIINIRLKKNKALGTNGSVSAGYNIAQNPRYNLGINLNKRNAKSNIYANINASRNKGLSHFNNIRTTADTIFESHNQMLNLNKGLNYKAGVDFFVDNLSTIGVMVNGSLFDMDMKTSGRSDISSLGSNQTYRYLLINNQSAITRNNFNSNLNYRRVDAKKGRELNVDLDFGRFDNGSDQYQPNSYYDFATNTKIFERNYRMLGPTLINLTSAKADYDVVLKSKAKLSLGFKSSYAKTNNDFTRFDVFNNVNVLDTARSNFFGFKENINAVYGSYAKPFKNFSLQAGLRMEQTTSKGTSRGKQSSGGHYANYDSGFKRNYVDFFPNISFTFNKVPTNQWTLSFTRRIDRPAYQDLNPFEMKMDEYTFMKGNTQLQPQYTNSIGLTNVYKYKLTTTLNYSHVTDIFAQLIDTAEVSKTMMTKKNLATQDIVSLGISYPFRYKKYGAFFNFNTYYSKFKADFGTGRKIDLDVFSGSLFSQQTYKFNDIITGELSGFYNLPGIYWGTIKSKAMGGVDMGASANLWKGKGNLKASVSDVFKTMKWGGTSNFAGQKSYAYGDWESRQFKLNFTYRFGSAEIKAARQRKTALEDESKRTQSSGGMGGQ